jgi:hypothetical protein
MSTEVRLDLPYDILGHFRHAVLIAGVPGDLFEDLFFGLGRE